MTEEQMEKIKQRFARYDMISTTDISVLIEEVVILQQQNKRLNAANEDMFQNREKWRESHMLLEQQVHSLQEQLELKDSEYQSAIDKVNRSTKVALEYQQQNKQLIEALEEIKDEEWRLAGEFTTIYTTAYLVLQQIQGNKT